MKLSKTKIRRLQKGDITQIINFGLSEKAFVMDAGVFWSRDQLEKWSESRSDVLLVAINQNNQVIVFSFYACHMPTFKVTWENLYVKPECREQGIASALIEEGMRILKDLGYRYIMLCVNSDDRGKFLGLLEKHCFAKGPEVIWVDKYLN
ncbi:MAG: GNAT family N-acetyltransferase [Minisyncoccia bacterium]